MHRMTKPLKVRLAVVAAAGSVGVIASASPALAINTVNPADCGWDSSLFGKHEYFAFVNIVDGQGLPLCFANVGRVDLKGNTRADAWRSGNNAGEFAYEDAAGHNHTRKFGKKEGDFNLGGKAKILWLQIN